MPTKIMPKISLADFIKLVWAVIIIYLGLSLSVQRAGESVLDLFKKDYLSKEDHQIYYSGYLDSHNISQDKSIMQDDFDNICNENQMICDKLTFKSEYDLSKKSDYLLGSVYIVWWIDEYMVLGRNIFKSFDVITLQKENSTKRAWTRWNNVFVNTNTITYNWEFSQLLGHEFWHIIDLYSIKWLSSKKDKKFTEFDKSVFSIDDPSIEFYKISWNAEEIRKSKSKKEDFCSWYGMYDPFEDFAECNNLYLNHNSVFKLFAKSSSVLRDKYNFVASIYDWSYFDKDTLALSAAKKKTSTWRPRDTTKMKVSN